MHGLIRFSCAALLILAPTFAPGAEPHKQPNGPGVASPPDLSGVWEPWLSHLEVNAEARLTLTRSKPQFTPEYEAKYDELKEAYSTAETGSALKWRDFPIIRRMVGECVPYGMPQMMGMDGDGAVETLHIAQTKNAILMIGEGGLGAQLRQIWLDRAQLPLEEVEPGYFGRSVGKWQGDVLHLNTIGIKKELEGQDLMPHSEQMVIDERIYLKDGLLIDEITITDPLALKTPWKYTSKFQPARKDYEPSEGYCENSNRYHFDKDGKLIVE